MTVKGKPHQITEGSKFIDAIRDYLGMSSLYHECETQLRPEEERFYRPSAETHRVMAPRVGSGC